MTNLRHSVLVKSLEYWHKKVREYGRAGDRHGMERSLAAVHRLERKLFLPLSYV